jgi:diacylglycerol O-acyltransferase / wax synthase
MEGVALTDEDRAILALESAAVAGHTCKVIVLGAPAPGLEELRHSIERRIGAAPELTRCLGGTRERPLWVDDEHFDIADHVVAAPADEELREAVARLFAERLDRGRPLWRIDVVPLAAGAALVWRTHHALADGTVAMRLADAVLWDPSPDARATARPHRKEAEAGRHGRLAAFVRHEVSLGSGRSPFDGPIGSTRAVAFASASLHELHDAAKRLAGATVNDAVLAAVAGSLRDWLQHHHGQLGRVRVKIPVSLHHADDEEGNRDSFFTLALPLGEPDPVARLTAIRAATAERKADHDAETLDQLLRDLAVASPRLAHFCRQLEASPRAFALNVSNVPGPPRPVTVLGAPVTDIWSLAEIGERHALRIAVVSVAGRLQFGFCSDPAIVADLDRLAQGVEAEAATLSAIR